MAEENVPPKEYWSIETSELKSFADDPTESAKRLAELRRVAGEWEIETKQGKRKIMLSALNGSDAKNTLPLSAKMHLAESYEGKGTLKLNGKLALEFGETVKLNGIIDAKALEGWGVLTVNQAEEKVTFRKVR